MDGCMISQVLPLVFSWPILAAMLFGVVFGILVGALPGLTATMGIAILLPLTFGMEPAPALLMLMAIYKRRVRHQPSRRNIQ